MNSFQGQNIVIWDATSAGKVANHLDFSEVVCDFFKEELDREYGKIDQNCACNHLRKKLIGAIRVNKNFVINIDKLIPDFSNHELFDSNMLFNFEELHKPENYMKLVNEDENYDALMEQG